MNFRASAAADLKSIQKPGPKLAIFFLERETLPKKKRRFPDGAALAHFYYEKKDK